jgi:hypothetical protein
VFRDLLDRDQVSFSHLRACGEDNQWIRMAF